MSDHNRIQRDTLLAMTNDQGGMMFVPRRSRPSPWNGNSGKVDLSRFDAALVTHLCSPCFEGNGAYPAQSGVFSPRVVEAVHDDVVVESRIRPETIFRNFSKSQMWSGLLASRM